MMNIIKQTPRAYLLTGIVDGKTTLYKKHFISRDQAINYMFDVYEKRLKENVQVEDEFKISKHNIEYVIDYHNRFRIARVG